MTAPGVIAVDQPARATSKKCSQPLDDGRGSRVVEAETSGSCRAAFGPNPPDGRPGCLVASWILGP